LDILVSEVSSFGLRDFVKRFCKWWLMNENGGTWLLPEDFRSTNAEGILASPSWFVPRIIDAAWTASLKPHCSRDWGKAPEKFFTQPIWNLTLFCNKTTSPQSDVACQTSGSSKLISPSSGFI
jgi:hypothetical protein